jgi:hypothetical protein
MFSFPLRMRRPIGQVRCPMGDDIEASGAQVMREDNSIAMRKTHNSTESHATIEKQLVRWCL